MSEDTPRKDAFIEMVTAKASVDLRQGRWNIHGLFLPDEVLRCVYRDNANRILKRPL